MSDPKVGSGIVVSAHSGDFVWRTGGAIALYAERGWTITVACLSFGERGESARLWRQPNMTLERVRLTRKEEACRAAEILGAQTVFFDLGDYPMRIEDESLRKLADIYQLLQPNFILTHSLRDPYNFDHEAAAKLAFDARIVAQAFGHTSPSKALGATPLFLFEPHQSEQCGWKPNVMLDIDSVWEKKHRAFREMTAQEHLWEYYERVALQRGAQASRNSDRKITYAEAYQRIFPQVVEDLA